MQSPKSPGKLHDEILYGSNDLFLDSAGLTMVRKTDLYHALTWPSLSYVAEDPKGRIVGYILAKMCVHVFSLMLSSAVHCLPGKKTSVPMTNPTAMSLPSLY